MKRIILVVIFYTFSFMSLLIAQDFSSDQKVYSTIGIDSDFADDRVLVVLNKQETMTFINRTTMDFDGLGIVAVEDLTRESKEALIQQISKRELLGLNGYELQGDSLMEINPQEFRTILLLTLEQPGKENVINAIKLLEQRDDILSTGVDFVLQPNSVPNDSLYNRQWALHERNGIKAPQAWGITNGTGSPPVRVGIIDTGIQGDHPDLNVNTALSRVFSLPDPYIPENVIYYRDHGTHVAGIVGAIGNNIDGITGVNWNVELVSLNIYPTGADTTFVSRLIKAVDFAGANGIPILNNSNGTNNFAGSIDDVNALTRAINNYPGLFVTSAGNANRDNDINNNRFPSNIRLPNLIAVGALNINGQRASYSNWGANTVCIFAPGGEFPLTNAGNGILSTIPTNLYSNIGVQGYGFMNGTSMAAPMVAGVASLMLSINPNLTSTDIRNIILDKSDHITISTPPSHSNVKKLNAYLSVLTALEWNNDMYIESTPIIQRREWDDYTNYYESYRLTNFPVKIIVNQNSGLDLIQRELRVSYHFQLQTHGFIEPPFTYITFLVPETYDYFSSYKSTSGLYGYTAYHCITEFIEISDAKDIAISVINAEVLDLKVRYRAIFDYANDPMREPFIFEKQYLKSLPLKYGKLHFIVTNLIQLILQQLAANPLLLVNQE